MISADAPIRSVDVAGLKRVELDGSRAKITVAKFSGMLEIDATLEGGKHARGSAQASGPRDVALATQLPSSKPSAKPKPTVMPVRTSELQSNPYGSP
jgi:hypothetical protein